MRENKKIHIISVTHSSWDSASTVLAYKWELTQTFSSMQPWFFQACFCSTSFSIISFVDFPSSLIFHLSRDLFCAFTKHNNKIYLPLLEYFIELCPLRRQQKLFQQPIGFFPLQLLSKALPKCVSTKTELPCMKITSKIQNKWERTLLSSSLIIVFIIYWYFSGAQSVLSVNINTV